MSKGLFSLFAFIAALAGERNARLLAKPHEHPHAVKGAARAREIAVSRRIRRFYANGDGTVSVSGRKCPGVVRVSRVVRPRRSRRFVVNHARRIYKRQRLAAKLLHRKSYKEACALGIAGV